MTVRRRTLAFAVYTGIVFLIAAVLAVTLGIVFSAIVGIPLAAIYAVFNLRRESGPTKWLSRQLIPTGVALGVLAGLYLTFNTDAGLWLIWVLIGGTVGGILGTSIAQAEVLRSTD